MNHTSKKQEDWLNRKWRPAMGWLYFVVCITDFIVFPILWTLYQTSITGVVTAWDPITLKGAGLFHMAMGAILGIAAWSRGQEKLYGVTTFGHETNTNKPVAPLRKPVLEKEPEL
jgi:uncharacterized membrane protein